ncbi:MAG: phosphoglycerate kinase [Chloroflexi bacterium]|nr:phosphoglycerate kinase [Chloroflexota bacterium]MBL7062398.1 phosphoglycerate kinase [Dehalococcoidia bacterium]
MAKKTIRDIEVEGKRVLVRVDFNVPLDTNTGSITDDSRIRAVLPTIRYLFDHKAKIILCSHLGRPDGKVVEGLRMAPIAKRLSQLIKLPVSTASDCIGANVEKAVNTLKEGDILLLENIRFHSEEEANDTSFAQALAKLADIYVDDAFGTAHRAHASTVGISRYLPAVAGFLMEKELKAIGNLLTNPEHPFGALLGGAKVSDKISLIQNILDKVDLLLIGGGMAATFLKAQGYEVGLSLVETDKQALAQELIEATKQKGISLLLPADVIVADSINTEATGKIVPIADIPTKKSIVDIGPKTVELFSQQMRQCKTVFWNGPMGVYEIPQFARGTKAMVELLASIKATTIVGGGSTAEIVDEMNLAHKMTHVSTGGGASLNFLEGKTLPGISVLLDKEK